MAAWRQHICCTREAPDRRQCPTGFFGMSNSFKQLYLLHCLLLFMGCYSTASCHGRRSCCKPHAVKLPAFCCRARQQNTKSTLAHTRTLGQRMNGRKLAICGKVTTPTLLCTGLCFASGSRHNSKRFPDPDALSLT